MTRKSRRRTESKRRRGGGERKRAKTRRGIGEEGERGAVRSGKVGREKRREEGRNEGSCERGEGGVDDR